MLGGDRLMPSVPRLSREQMVDEPKCGLCGHAYSSHALFARPCGGGHQSSSCRCACYVPGPIGASAAVRRYRDALMEARWALDRASLSFASSGNRRSEVDASNAASAIDRALAPDVAPPPSPDREGE